MIGRAVFCCGGSSLLLLHIQPWQPASLLPAMPLGPGSQRRSRAAVTTRDEDAVQKIVFALRRKSWN